MNKLICLLAILACLLASCVGASTSFAWRSVTYHTIAEAANDVKLTEKPGDASVNAEKTTSDFFKASAGEGELADGK